MTPHLWIILFIIVLAGAFGGYLNYLHKFDITADSGIEKNGRLKYILLGIGAALLVPSFLKMIASDLVNSASLDASLYFVFAGFCLIAAIFSRRFITTIGEKVLETANQAKKIAEESKKAVAETQSDVMATRERVEDVKLAVDIQNDENRNNAPVNEQLEGMPSDSGQLQQLLSVAANYEKDTSVPDYNMRVKLKAEMGRKMGEIIVRNRLNRAELANNELNEGLRLALAYAAILNPTKADTDILLGLAAGAKQKYTRYAICSAFDTLVRNNLADALQMGKIETVLAAFKTGADLSLSRKIQESTELINIHKK